MLTILLACALSSGPAVQLDNLTLGDAVSLHGQLVRVSLTVGQPVYDFQGVPSPVSM